MKGRVARVLITKILGTVQEASYQSLPRDLVPLHLETARKRIFRVTSEAGRDIAARFEKAMDLQSGDVLAVDEGTALVVSILPEDALLVFLQDIAEATRFAYEIGNRHAPLYRLPEEQHAYAVLYDVPLEILCKKLGITFRRQKVRLEAHDRLQLLTPAHEGHRHGG